ncbi:MAG: sulfotransferase [bacterium]
MTLNLPPLFIGGSRRCGTTFLSDLLGQHPSISPIYETDFVLAMLEGFSESQDLPLEEKLSGIREFSMEWAKTLPHAPGESTPNNKGDHESYSHGSNYFLVTTEEFREHTKQFLGEMQDSPGRKTIAGYLNKLFELHCEKDGKPNWLNKTPRYAQFTDTLLDWFPEMIFIHIVRDGRDVVASMMNYDWAPDSIETASLRWMDYVYQARSFGERHPEHYVELRFETLMKRPERCLTSLLRQITDEEHPGEDLVQTMLDKVRDTNRDVIGKWKRSLNQQEVETFYEKAGGVFQLMGYDR